MPNTKPLVAAAFVCERVLTEKDNVQSAVRLVDNYTIREITMPVAGVMSEGVPVQVIDLTTFVVLKAGDVTGKYEATIVLRAPDGKTRQMPAKWKFEFTKPDDGASLVSRFAMPVTAPEGLYWFDVVWKGETLTSIPLRLIRAPKSQAPAQGETS